jgi:hypothetical protein
MARAFALLVGAFLLIFGLGALASLFAWTFFDATWWVSAPPGNGRHFGVVMFHIFSLIFGSVFGAVIFGEALTEEF